MDAGGAILDLMRRSSLLFAAIALFSLGAPRPSHADTFKLKDGSTIVGTVVGYEGNSFKVKTNYGYALVEKDKIVSIQIAGAPATSSEKKAKPDAMKAPATEHPITKVAKSPSSDEHAKPPETKALADAVAVDKPKPEIAATSPTSASARSGENAVSGSAAQTAAAAAAKGAANAQPSEMAANAPNALPGPEPIREKISGNTYINDTYEFEMYKPPDWEIMDGARSVLPGAVAAMGTDDQSTYLVVGQQSAGKSATDEIATMEKRLSDILVDFRPLSDEHLTISGEQVVAHRFRGSVDEHDWSGFMVFMPRGAKLYTIFGMTRADNDLVQIQENVIRRTIASFQFLPQ